MAEAINYIVSGKYQSYHVYWDSSIAFLGQDEKLTITRENVTSVVQVSEQNGNVLGGALFAGVTGAMIAKDMGGYIMAEINWKDGSKSLVKLAKGAYEIVLASSYKSNEYFAANLRRQADEERKKKEEEAKLIAQARADEKRHQEKWNTLTEEKKKAIIERERPGFEKRERELNAPSKLVVGVSLFFLITGVINLVLGIDLDWIVSIVGGAVGLAIGLAFGIYALAKRFAKVHLSDNEVETRIMRQGVPEIE